MFLFYACVQIYEFQCYTLPVGYLIERLKNCIYIFVSDCQVNQSGFLLLGLSFSTPFIDRCPISGDLEELIKHLKKE